MRDLDDIELRALAFIDERELVRDLVEMVGVPSVSGHPAESDLLLVLAKQLGALDLELDLWPLDLPTLTSSPQFPGWEVPREEAWGLVATATDSGGDRSARPRPAGSRRRGATRRPVEVAHRPVHSAHRRRSGARSWHGGHEGRRGRRDRRGPSRSCHWHPPAQALRTAPGRGGGGRRSRRLRHPDARAPGSGVHHHRADQRHPDHGQRGSAHLRDRGRRAAPPTRAPRTPASARSTPTCPSTRPWATSNAAATTASTR